jgi:hypothetical protein
MPTVRPLLLNSEPGPPLADRTILRLSPPEAYRAVPRVADRPQVAPAIAAARPVAWTRLMEETVRDHLDRPAPAATSHEPLLPGEEIHVTQLPPS